MAGVYGGFRQTPPVADRRQRVLAYVTREREGRTELLVFDHRDEPGAGTQVPAGRLDPGESLEEGLLRELHEEAGLDRVSVVRELPVLGAWASASEYENHAFEVRVEGEAPADTWEHMVHGAGDDAGFVFVYRWVAVEPELDLWHGEDPTYTQLA
jgi:8-oxo-dGTP pyrophosphatase MutT (NUDIX family)